jgi:C-terminal processing protease CtpA/Prc
MNVCVICTNPCENSLGIPYYPICNDCASIHCIGIGIGTKVIDGSIPPIHEVNTIVNQSPAHNAGIKNGDILLEVNGHIINEISRRQLKQQVDYSVDKTELSIILMRKSKKIKFLVNYGYLLVC